MKKILFVFLQILGLQFLVAQQDSLYIKAKINADVQQISVEQRLVFHNKTGQDLSKIKLLNWVNAYQKENSPLAKRKLSDRQTGLYFAQKKELGQCLSFDIESDLLEDFPIDLQAENIYLSLKKPLPAGQSIQLNYRYTLQLPQDRFSTYGWGKNQLYLKYFFIVPDSFETLEQKPRYFLDIEDSQNIGTYWEIDLDQNLGKIYSNLPVIGQKVSGWAKKDPQIMISAQVFPSFYANVDGQKTEVSLGYDLPESDKNLLEFYLPLQLKFIKDRLGSVPSKIFISQRARKKYDFGMNEDLKFWKFKLKINEANENLDMDYFSVISQLVCISELKANKEELHWLQNGIKTMLEIDYLKKNYPDKKLLGQLNDFSILGIKPLKMFHASKISLQERYYLAYEYIRSQNLDQAIATPYSALSNYNQEAISVFETGLLFNFMAEHLGRSRFYDFLKKFTQNHQNKLLKAQDFGQALEENFGQNTQYLSAIIPKKNRINLSLKQEDQAVIVESNTPLSLPYLWQHDYQNGQQHQHWGQINQPYQEAPKLKLDSLNKLSINPNYLFPEANFRDNFIYPSSFIGNIKNIQWQLFTDLPNHSKHQVFINPNVNWNNYDKLILGLTFENYALFQKAYRFSLSPSYSFGTQSLTGSASTAYTHMPADAFYRSLNLGTGFSYFHYDRNLPYFSGSVSASMQLNKEPRSQIFRSFGMSYSHVNRELSETLKAINAYSTYNLLNANFTFTDVKAIHEKYIFSNLQFSEDFVKLSSDAFYRWEYGHRKKISFRVFLGYFLHNQTRNSLFNFGVSRVSNYGFNFGLLGQSATTGILAQQFVLAEGGFKSYFGGSVNQFILSHNVDAHLWRWFNLYADVAVAKNRGFNPVFLWDSGIKVKVIPDFLEVFFPLQSSLGFEPSFSTYGQRIRFSLNINFNSLVQYFSRDYF